MNTRGDKVTVVKFFHPFGDGDKGLNFAAKLPSNTDTWQNVRMIDGNVDHTTDYDYVVVLNTPRMDTTVHVVPDNLWCLLGEPDDPYCAKLHSDRHEYGRVFGPSEQNAKEEPNYHLSNPFLGSWHVKKTRADLFDPHNLPLPPKKKRLSFITSNNCYLLGHRRRLRFLLALRKAGICFDLFGYGFNPVDDKWDAIAPYCYTIAFENYSSNYYWSEKLTDAFIAETMPIYYGCRQITRYFPQDSMVIIDPDDRFVFEKIRAVIQSDLYIEKKAAILEAKDLCLNTYPDWVRVANMVNNHKSGSGQKQTIVLGKLSQKAPFLLRLVGFIMRQYFHVLHQLWSLKLSIQKRHHHN